MCEDKYTFYFIKNCVTSNVKGNFDHLLNTAIVNINTYRPVTTDADYYPKEQTYNKHIHHMFSGVEFMAIYRKVL